MKTGRFDNAETVQIRTRGKGYGLFFMVIEGEINILDQGLGARDAIGIWDEDSISFQCKQASRLLLIDLPMTV
jgi:redox-sensitive bicupin YhaK (pirin superfamily)